MMMIDDDDDDDILVYLACVVMVAPIIRSIHGNTSIYGIYVVCGPAIYAFWPSLYIGPGLGGGWYWRDCSEWERG